MAETNLGVMDEYIAMSEEYYEEWEDGSDIGCGDCPESECTGHCMSCAYRSF